LRALRTVAPVAGLWAFSTVLEEEAPKKKWNLEHVPALMTSIETAGVKVDATPPVRSLDAVRAAALHPTPKSPAPTGAEVNWFREAAHAYLMWRAGRNLTTSSQLP